MKAMRFVVLTAAAATWSKKALKRDTIASSPSPGGHLTIEASVYVPLEAQAESEALLCPSRPNRMKARRPKKAEREGKQWYKYTMKADGNWFQWATSPLQLAHTYTKDVRNTWRLITPCVLYSLAEEVVVLLAAIAYGDHRQMLEWMAS